MEPGIVSPPAGHVDNSITASPVSKGDNAEGTSPISGATASDLTNVCLMQTGYTQLLSFCGMDSTPRTQQFPMSILDFLVVAEKVLDNEALQNGCAKLELLPGRRKEKRVVLDSIQTNSPFLQPNQVSARGIEQNECFGGVAVSEGGMASLEISMNQSPTSSPEESPVRPVRVPRGNSNSSGLGGAKAKAVELSAIQSRAKQQQQLREMILSECPYAVDDVVYIIEGEWWQRWCEYAQVSAIYDCSGTVVLTLNDFTASASPDSVGADTAPKPGGFGSSARPLGIENSILLDQQSASVITDECSFTLRDDLLSSSGNFGAKSSQSASKTRGGEIWRPRYVAIPKVTWDILFQLYGGTGPVLHRKVTGICTPTLSGDGRTVNIRSPQINTDLEIKVDLYPTVLNSYWCGVLGHADEQFQQPIYVPENCSSIDDLVRFTMRSYYGVHVNMPGRGAAGTRSGSRSGSVSLSIDDVRVWVLYYSDGSNLAELLSDSVAGAGRKEEDCETERERFELHSNTVFNGGSARTEPESETGTGDVRKQLWSETGVLPTSTGSRRGAVGYYGYHDLIGHATGRMRHSHSAVWLQIPQRWRLKQRRHALYPAEDTCIATLESLGIVSGTKIMFESVFSSPLAIDAVTRIPFPPVSGTGDWSGVGTGAETSTSEHTVDMNASLTAIKLSQSPADSPSRPQMNILWPTQRLYEPRATNSRACQPISFTRGNVIDATDNRGEWRRATVMEKYRVVGDKVTVVCDNEEGQTRKRSMSADNPEGSFYKIHVCFEKPESSTGANNPQDTHTGRSVATSTSSTVGTINSISASGIAWEAIEHEFETESLKIAHCGWYTAPLAHFPPLQVSSILALVLMQTPSDGISTDDGDGEGELDHTPVDAQSGSSLTHQLSSGVSSLLSSVTRSGDQVSPPGGVGVGLSSMLPHGRASVTPEDFSGNCSTSSNISVASSQGQNKSQTPSTAGNGRPPRLGLQTVQPAQNSALISILGPQTGGGSDSPRQQGPAEYAVTPCASRSRSDSRSDLNNSILTPSALLFSFGTGGSASKFGSSTNKLSSETTGECSPAPAKATATPPQMGRGSAVVRSGGKSRRKSNAASGGSYIRSNKHLGICGLNNMGNTCFLASGLQCLSHTPLLILYFLSGKYKHDINTKNVLGTSGKLTEEYASLLFSLYNSGFTSVTPNKFKNCLSKFKSQFRGYEQQDAQEFLAEILDCFHEDLNRVAVKPYLEPPPDEVAEKMTDDEHATDGWNRHLARNSSVFVDLFQGQSRTTVSCPVCRKTSRTFDPFMFLSLPLPSMNQKTVCVTVVHRMERYGQSLEFNRVKVTHEKSRSSDSHVVSVSRSDNGNRFVVSSTPHCSRYALDMVKTAKIIDLKTEISKQIGVPVSHLVALDLSQSKLQRILEDTEVISQLTDGNSLVNAAETYYNFYESCNVPEDNYYTHGGWCAGMGVCHIVIQEALKDLPFITGLDSDRLLNRRAYLPNLSEIIDASNAARSHGAAGAEGQQCDLYPDFAEYEQGCLDEEGDLIVDIDNFCALTQPYLQEPQAQSSSRKSKQKPKPPSEPELPYPFVLADLVVGQRVDAVDHRGQWFAGSVMELRDASNDPDPPDTENAAGNDVGAVAENPSAQYFSGGEAGLYARVHFDGFSSKWDEWYLIRRADSSDPSGYQEYPSESMNPSYGRVCPIYSHAARKLRIIELGVHHRQIAENGIPEKADGVQRMELTAIPFILHCESFRSTEHAYRLILEQVVKYMTNDDWNLLFARACQHDHRLVNVMGNRAAIWEQIVCSPLYSGLLPFTVRLSSLQHQLTAPPEVLPLSLLPELPTLSDENRLAHTVWEGMLFPRDVDRPLCNVHHSKLIITVDWNQMVPFYCSPAFFRSTPLGDAYDEDEQEDLLVESILWKPANSTAVRGSGSARQDDVSIASQDGDMSVSRGLFAALNGVASEVLREHSVPCPTYNPPYRFLTTSCFEHYSYIKHIYSIRADVSKLNNSALINTVSAIMTAGGGGINHNSPIDHVYTVLTATAAAIGPARSIGSGSYYGSGFTSTGTTSPGMLGVTPPPAASNSASPSATTPVRGANRASLLRSPAGAEKRDAITIYRCLDNYTKEEQLEDESW